MKAYSIPTFVTEVRLSHQMSQSEFAKYLGCSAKIIYETEAGRYKMPKLVIKLLLPRLGQDERERLKDIIAEDYLRSL